MITSIDGNDAMSSQQTSHPSQQVLKRVVRVWRRAGVRPSDRTQLLAELDGELQAAHEIGAPVSSVLGDDTDSTLRAWAQERGLAGRSLRTGLLIAVGLLGVLLGAATLIALLIADIAPMVTSINPATIPGGLALTIVASSGLMSVLMPVLGCWAALQAGRDPLAGATARWLLLTVPLGEAAAVGLGVGVAALMNYTYDAFPFVVIVVLATMAAAVLIGRAVAIRRDVAASSPVSSTDMGSTW